ncbi:MAG: 4-alpha-glucanotransferase [Anaerovoracaceae bacterium]|jgi:4-alpha-glucanotransferase
MEERRKRKSGLLMPVFSLPSEGGVGCFSDSAYVFIERLRQAGQSYWQILPLSPVGGWYSPYQPESCFAGEILYICPGELSRRGLVTAGEMAEYHAAVQGAEPGRVDYARVIPPRAALLRCAFSRFRGGADYEQFCEKNADWLGDFAVYSALRKSHGGKAWHDWEKRYRERDEDALAEYVKANGREIEFYKWTQYEFFREWKQVKDFANRSGIEIIGDMPIYAAYKSCDCWTHPELFKFNDEMEPAAVAGCPPDAFAPDGQKWGNPLYRWPVHRKTGFEWWKRRIRRNFELYDVIRFDHIRGLVSYYSIDRDENASEGRWIKGPGFGFIKSVARDCGGRFIAEDLGTITPAVRRLIKRSGFPGMKVLQFAFDGNPKNPYLPENIGPDSVVYTGTHDNNTTRAWYISQTVHEQKLITSYIRERFGGAPDGGKAPLFDSKEVTMALMQLAMHSKADTCILPVQDVLLKGSEARINTPGTTGRNWEWRLTGDESNTMVVDFLLGLTKESGRL